MQLRKMGSYIIVIWILSAFTLTGTVHADWARHFVVYDGNSYSITDIPVDASQIGNELGKVTSYSDEEGIYSGHFSNYYPVGTPYYAIQKIETDEAIAVNGSDGMFIRASYEGAYGGGIISWGKVGRYVAGSFAVIIVSLLIWNNWGRAKREVGNEEL
ncbi:hypothetical protein FHS16_001007 [Paenibacillus endophyticus]|uniref:WG repeat-containing protein n=1 Tax=Paenibacillus endophyticus TaxID=1294268 RepID=A0A7W5C4N4_9BACL|nr:hypothetical protein [Paenibacillus endophyticus]MBB3150973.1 hypothetical protein [Paenibacillus endophyticus]